ncbi:hypothetical protein SESBI_10818 [Sesbania bispinosa]|nr:hypothetical protein SESBI_10818 [Sesbania bispinosa]
MDAKAMKSFSKAGRRKQGPQVSLATSKWWHWFQGYEGKQGSEVSSIFDRRFPTEQVIQSHFCNPDDRIRIRKVDMLNTAKMVQTFTTQAAFLGHALESGVGLLEKELKEKIQKLKGSRRRGELSDFKKEKEKSDNLQEERTKLLKTAEEKLVSEQNKRKTEVNNLKAEITFQYEQGFDKAIVQVKFLYPELNVEELGAFKEI